MMTRMMRVIAVLIGDSGLNAALSGCGKVGAWGKAFALVSALRQEEGPQYRSLRN